MSRAHDPPDGPGDIPDTPAGLQQCGGRTGRVYTPASWGFLLIRRVAEARRDGLVSLLEVYPPQQVLHPEGRAIVVLQEQVYLVEVVLGP
jgi:hypothetical protein